jgi:hypothetical protein
VVLGLAPIFAGIARVRETLPEVSGGSTWQGYVQGYSADALGLFQLGLRLEQYLMQEVLVGFLVLDTALL